MPILALEPTNRCNRHCLHCFRNRADAEGFLPLDLAENILSQAEALKVEKVSLTGGELSLYPHLEDLLHLIVRKGFSFDLVTNGNWFKERLLPLLTSRKIKKRLLLVSFSLDGVRSQSHDALRGQGSFHEVMQAVGLCEMKGLPFELKTALTVFNQHELTDLALLGASLGATTHNFLYTFPTPRALREKAIPSPGEQAQLMGQLENLAKSVRSQIVVSGYEWNDLLLSACRTHSAFNVDYCGHLIFCCNLSHLTREAGLPTCFGEELVADLKEVTLKEGIRRHLYLAARLLEARINDLDHLNEITKNPCFWCLKYFGKFDWLKDFSDSPWAAGVWPGETGEAKESLHNLLRTG